MNEILRIEDNSLLIALVLFSTYSKPGLSFVTPPHFSQQLAYQRRAAGEKVNAHFHNTVPREVTHSLEVLVIKKGRVKVDLYNSEQRYVGSVILQNGDTIFLAAGGHGLEMLEEVELIEVKQGPYPGSIDKTLFQGISPDREIILNP